MSFISNSDQPPAPCPNCPPARSIAIPGLQAQIRLGDAIANLTRRAGIQPCGGCKARQEALNRRFTLTPWGNR